MPLFYPPLNAQIGGNTSGTTTILNTGTITFAGGNNVTLSQNGNAITISAANTSAQTNQSLGFYASSQTTGGSSSSTFDARSVTWVGQGAVSVGATNGSWIISAPNTIAQSNQSLGFYGLSQTTGASSSSTVDARSVSFVGQGAVSVGASNGSWLISAPNTIAQSNQSLGFYASSQTMGTSSSTLDARSVTFVGSGGVSVGASNGSWVISGQTTAAQSLQSYNILAAGSQTANTTGSVLFQNSNGITFGMSNNSVITASYTQAVTAQTKITLSQWPWPMPNLNASALAPALITTGATGGSSQSTASYRMNVFPVEQDISYNRIVASLSFSQPVTGQGSATAMAMYGLYSQAGGTVFNKVTDWVINFRVSQSAAGGTAHTHLVYWGTNSTSNSTNYNGNSSSLAYGALKGALLFEGASSLARGMYYLVNHAAFSTANANVFSLASLAGISHPAVTNMLGGTSVDSAQGVGIFSSTSNNTFAFDTCMPAAIGTGAITNTATIHNFQPLIFFKMT